MNPNVATLILAGATPVEITPGNPSRKPARIGARSADGRRVLGQRASRHRDDEWIFGDWAVWETSTSTYRPAYRPTYWEDPDAHWDQVPPEVLAEFVEGA